MINNLGTFANQVLNDGIVGQRIVGGNVTNDLAEVPQNTQWLPRFLCFSSGLIT